MEELCQKLKYMYISSLFRLSYCEDENLFAFDKTMFGNVKPIKFTLIGFYNG
jgi:hypothetical protein